MTTVGYGDIVPQTVLGQLLAAVVMLLGFGIIAIPTGIITVETMQQVHRNGRSCLSCGASAHRNPSQPSAALRSVRVDAAAHIGVRPDGALILGKRSEAMQGDVVTGPLPIR